MQQELRKFVYKSKAEYILQHTELLELEEVNLIKVFVYNQDYFMEDDYLLELVDQTYKKICSKKA